MRRILASLLFGAGILAAPLLAQASPCSPSMTYTTGQTLTAAVLNSNPTTFSGCFNNIDNTNIGAAGIYASQLLPTNASQATFGGGQNYTFTNNLTVSGTLTAAIIGGLYPSAIVPTTGAQATFGGSQLFTFPNGVAAGGPVSGTTGTFSGGVSGTTGTFSGAVSNAGSTSTGALKQTVGTTYTLPYDANSTSGSTNTHIEHGIVATGAFSIGFACSASTNFAKAFTASPTVIGILASALYPAAIYPGTVSATAFTLCGYLSGQSGGTIGINWIAVGE